MPLDKNVTEQLIEKYRVTPNDTGSSEVQISLLTSRITNLTDHLRNNNHDQSSKRGLLKLVGTFEISPINYQRSLYHPY